jgi:hypothetical protein
LTQDAAEFTLAEASELLDPFVSEEQLRLLVKALRLPSLGRRHTGRRGHPETTYSMALLAEVHAANAKFLARFGLGRPRQLVRVIRATPGVSRVGPVNWGGIKAATPHTLTAAGISHFAPVYRAGAHPR